MYCCSSNLVLLDCCNYQYILVLCSITLPLKIIKQLSSLKLSFRMKVHRVYPLNLKLNEKIPREYKLQYINQYIFIRNKFVKNKRLLFKHRRSLIIIF